MKRRFYCAVLATALSLWGVARADNVTISETEPNQSWIGYPAAGTQTITVPQKAGDTLTINGVMGTLVLTKAIKDLDFYTFYAQADEVLSFDITCGYACGTRSVKTILGVFGGDFDPSTGYSGSYPLNRQQQQNCGPVDPNTGRPGNACIDKFKVPSSGMWTVGVSSLPRSFMDGSYVWYPNSLPNYSNGDYTLVVTLVQPAIMQINVAVNPANMSADNTTNNDTATSPTGGKIGPINLTSKGAIRVALLSSSDFNAMNVDTTSLTFGKTGLEHSLRSCEQGGVDVNHDGRLDLVCHFDTQKAGFQPCDIEGIVSGKMSDPDDRKFEGRGTVQFVPPTACVQ